MFVISHQTLKKTLWKNGLGLTTPVLSSPQDSLMTDFDWRISFAEMNADTKFSEFPGYDRALAVIDGDALLINRAKHQLFTPFYFPGELVLSGVLAGRPLIDFGVIWKRGLFDVELQFLGTDQNNFDFGFVNQSGCQPSEETVLIFVVSGALTVKGEVALQKPLETRLSRFDSFVFDPGRDRVAISASPGAIAARVAIKRLNV